MPPRRTILILRSNSVAAAADVPFTAALSESGIDAQRKS
jgi:hypothetical protein